MSVKSNHSMLKCCRISKPVPLNPPHLGTLNVGTERPRTFTYPLPYEVRDRDGSCLFSTTFD